MKRDWQLIVHEQYKSPIAEAYRTLRTNINFCKPDGELKTIMFTSAGPGEGKSLTAANSAVALAQTGKQVILVDCDLRKPVQQKVFSKSANFGVTNYLINEDAGLDALLQPSGVENLRLLLSGPVPPNPSELLGASRMDQLIGSLRQSADCVIFDAPPVIAVTDACVLVSRLDGVILVLGADIVRPEMARQAKDLLLKAKADILGAVLNRIEIEDGHSYYYYYYGDDRKAAGR